MLVLKYLLFLIVTFVMLIVFTYLYYFNTYSNNIIKAQDKIAKTSFSDFINESSDYILHNQTELLKLNLNALSKTNVFKNITIELTEHLITKKNIILNAEDKIDFSWQLHDVLVDDSYGELNQIDPLIYVLNNENDFDYSNELIIKFQASSFNEITNTISKIKFNMPKYNKTTVINQTYLSSLLRKVLPIKDNIIKKKIYAKLVLEYAIVSYVQDNNLIYDKIQEEITQFFYYLCFIFIILFILFYIFNYIHVQGSINKSLRGLNEYTDDILNNRFYTYKNNNIHYEDIKNVSTNISLLSSKMAKLMSEMIVNRNMIEVNIATDSLTNLPTNKIFVNDMKMIYLNKTNSYIIKIKLACLHVFSQRNTIENTDKLIKTFVTSTKDAMNINKDKEDLSFYRINGSDFIIIAKNFRFLQLNELMEDIVKENDVIKNNFDIESKIIHMVSIPFNQYSSTMDLDDELTKLYSNTHNSNEQITYHIDKRKEHDSINVELEKEVSDIIHNNTFDLSYKYNTYTYDNEIKTLLMQEVVPNIINSNDEVMPIGTFIAVAQEMELAIEFDKKLITKVFEHIKESEITHKYAINLSIHSILNNEFMIWLESKLLFDYHDFVENTVFSITSFTAKNNFDEFLQFTNNVKRFNSQIILKRFSYDDFTKEQLNKIDISYIRVHSHETNNINSDKKIRLHKIADYSLSKNMLLLADDVQNEEDNNILKSLGFYGTSK